MCSAIMRAINSTIDYDTVRLGIGRAMEPNGVQDARLAELASLNWFDDFQGRGNGTEPRRLGCPVDAPSVSW